MSKIKDALVTDVPVNDTDYDYVKFEREMDLLEGIDRTEENIDHAKEMQEELDKDNYSRNEEDYQSEIARF